MTFPVKISRLFVGAAAVLFITAVSHAGLLTALDGFWTFDETSGTFADFSGNGRTLTAAGNPHGDGTNGIIGGALDLDQSGTPKQYAYDATGSVGAYNVTDSFTASFWLKYPEAIDEFAVFLARADGDRGWQIRNGPPGERERLALWFTGDGTSFNRRSVNTFTDGNKDQWTHFVVRYDSTAAQPVSFYRNDSWLNIATSSGSPDLTEDYLPAPGTSFSVGARDHDSGGPFNGMIDEMGLWSRALTRDEITALYNSGAGLRVPEPASAAMLLMLLMAAAGVRPRRRR